MALYPSSLPRNWIHDVFPSFHGADVRTTFLSHVLKEFKRRGIDTFIDNNIERSKSIGPKLTEAIRGSRVAIVLLSRNYASSTWCLNELVEITKCRREFGQTVIPIFYEVDPSDVKKQAGGFGKVFENTCDGKTEEETRRWREALAEVATIAGEHSRNWCSEAEMIEKIAADVSNVLNDSVPSNYCESLVGIAAHMERMRSLLSLECDEVRMVGIWGPAGIGKTTIARALYEKLCSNFTHTAFMESIKGGCTKIYLDNYAYMLQLQEQLLSKTFGHKDLNIGHLGVAQERLKNKKVLVVLDDVDRLVQLNAMADKPEWFGHGSRIIITTKDQKLLKAHGIDHIYKVDYPIDEEALQIFCTYAFGQNSPEDGFEELALEVTNLSGKLPLGLSIMGSFFRGMSKHEWINALPRLRSRLHDDIKSILRFSYDALCDEDKELFLYIACFFNLKSIQTLEDHLERTFLNLSHGLHILAERSLISREYGFIKMHNLLVQLGRDLVRSQSVHKPGKRQFLVDAREICQVLTNETGSESLVGMDLDLSEINKEFDISKITFKRMSNLQFLRFYRRFDDKGNSKLHSPKNLKYLSPKLSLVHWDYFPGTCLPSTFITEFLVELNMRNSKLTKLWEGVQPLQNLKWVDLSHSSEMKELPDLSTATNLLSLDLSYCTSLVELPFSVGNATNLLILNIECCNNLVEIPSSVENIPNVKIFFAGCSSVVKLPSCVWNITSLNTFNLESFSSLVQSPLMWNAKIFQGLDLSGCSSLKNLPPIVNDISGYSQSAEFPSFIASIRNLHELILSNCSSLMELPDSIGNATNLKALDLSGCSSLKTLPSSIGNVKNLHELILSNCSNLVELPTSIENATNLKTLDLSGCSSLVKLPFSIGNVKNLIKLVLSNCSNLVELPASIENATNLKTLDLSGCSSLVKLPFYIGNVKNLINLVLSNCSNLVELPPSIRYFTSLKTLDLSGCSSLVTLPSVSHSATLMMLNVTGCSSLKELPSSIENLCDVPGFSLKGWSKPKPKAFPTKPNFRSLHALDERTLARMLFGRERQMALASGDNIEDTETDNNEPLDDQSCASAVDNTNLKNDG